MALSQSYPWYELVTSRFDAAKLDKNGDAFETLDQGDILLGCPVLAFQRNAPFPVPADDVPGDKLEIDVLVLTQTCDFEQHKATSVLVCRHESASQIGKNKQSEIIKGRQPRYAMLEKSSLAERGMGLRVVDLSDIYQLPIEFVRQVADAQTPRLRLLPPYREHISQAFARFWMRIGFPQDINLD